MRKFLFLFSFAIAVSANAGILQSANLNAATLNFATTYTLSGAHNISVPLGEMAGQLCWNNQTGAVLAMYVDNDLSVVAPTVDVKDIYMPAGVSQCLPLNVRLTRTLQVRSASGSIVSSGSLYLYITDKRG